MAETMGHTVEELERMNVRDFVAPEHVESVLAYIGKTIDTGSASGLECDWITRDGHRIPMEINSTARYSESGAFIATRCIVRDVTIRRRMEDRLVESEKLRATAEMSAGVGHNFNNLLTVIYARTRAIQAAAGNPTAVIREAKAIDAVVTDASALARRLQTVPSGPLADTAPVDIGRLVTEVVEMTRPRWQEPTALEGRPVDVDIELAETPVVIGSAPALREVLTNLIYNAVDAMPEGGTCTIRTAEQDGYVVISVTGTGTGMDEETKRRIFEPFFTTKGHGSGNGLGLFTVYHIVRQHDGNVTADASAGLGTTFSVRLPVART
jgi:PAS domain S-box-containing protein